MPMRSNLPSGTVTFLFTDVEGSTKLLHELGADGYAEALAEHRRIVREACAHHDGVEVDTQGDAFFVAFPTAPAALAAAAEMTRELASGPIQVRIGVHTGTPLLTEEGYVGGDVHRAARIAAAGHGGQVLVSASTATLVEIELRDLGEHRFKDLGAPERVYQLGADDFPALKSLYRTNLPVPTTPFLGRERELGEVVGLLGDTRLLTLTGPGGTGKTRLAAQAAGMAGDSYPDGVWWVPLAALREAELVLETAAQIVGSQNGLAEHIADRSMLLLFDNFEQVVEAAGDVAGLLISCPNLDLLVTSREPLHVTGEQEYAVPPLVHQEGVGFFLARARSVKADFAVDDAVSEICRRLDDLPLALELAAARVKALSSAQILERLEQRLPLLTGGARDLPERQRTLRGAIEWSYELLTEDEQRLFARLSVFRGGCTLEAAEEVCEADLDTLQSLVDKSLLRHADERYWLLETIREYASEKLEESGEAKELHDRYAGHFLALAEEAEPHLRAESEEWPDRLEREHDNLRAALDELSDDERAMRLAGAIYRFWYMKSHLAEGLHRLETVLATGDDPSPARAKALTGASVMAVNLGELDVARTRAEQSLELYRRLGDPWGTAYATMMIGNALGEADVAAAAPFLEEAIERFRELGDEQYTLIAMTNLAWVVGELGDLEQEKRLYEAILPRARALGNRHLEAFTLGTGLSYIARTEGQLVEAASMLRESFRIFRELGDRWQQVLNLGRMGAVLADQGRPNAAVQLVASEEALTDAIGAKPPSWAARRNEDTLTVVRSQLDEPAFEKAWEEGRRMTLDEAVALALAED
jgi:predicted ATPase